MTTATLAINVTQVNQPPTVSVPPTQNSLENNPIAFSKAGGNAISVDDFDSNGGAEQATLTANNGTLSLATSAGLTFNSGSSSGQSSMTFTGTLAAINAALDGLILTPTNFYSGQAGVTIAIDDLGNSGASSAQSASGRATVQFAQVNQAPSISAPASQTVDENVPVYFSSGSGNTIAVTDLDSGGGSEQVTLDVQHGRLTLASTQNLTFSNGTNSNRPSIHFTGTISDLNAALNGLIYTPTARYFGPDTIHITLNDLGHTGIGGSLQDSRTVNLTVRQVNQPPSIATPIPQTLGENTSLLFSSATGNAIVASDSDAAGAAEQFSLSMANGTLSLAGTTGITFINGTINDSSVLTFTGSLASINSALDGLVLRPSPDFTGQLSLGLVIDDLGNTGLGGSSVFGINLPITVTQVSYQPSVTNSSTLINQQSVAGLVITPNALDGTSSGYYQIANITGGNVYLADGLTPIAEGQFITFAQGASGLKFTPAHDFVGNASFTVQASSTAGNAGLVSGTVTATIAVTTVIVPPNAPPSIAAGGSPLSYLEGQGLAAIDPALTVADPDSVSLVASTIRLMGYVQGEDTLGFTNQNGITGTWNATNGLLTLSGSATVAQYQAALRAVTYVNSSQDPSVVPRTAEFSVSDGQAWSPAVDCAINVTAVNNAPVVILPSPQTMLEDATLVFSKGSPTAILLSDVDADGATEQVTLTADHGSLSLSGTQGLTFTDGTGSNDRTLQFAGTLNDLNAALNGATFTTSLYFNGQATIHITISDEGSTGIGGAQIAERAAPDCYHGRESRAGVVADSKSCASPLLITRHPILMETSSHRRLPLEALIPFQTWT